MAQPLRHRTDVGYSVLDELSDVQVELLVFLAGRCSYPPRGFVPATTDALAWRNLIVRDGRRWHATEAGRHAVDALPGLGVGVCETYSVAYGSRSLIAATA